MFPAHFGFLSGSLLLSSKNICTSLPFNNQSFSNNIYIYCIFKVLKLSGHKKSNFYAHDHTHGEMPSRCPNEGRTTFHWCRRGEAESRFKDSHSCRVTHPKTVVFVGRSVSRDWWGNMEQLSQPSVASEPWRGSKILAVYPAHSRLPLPNPTSFPVLWFWT